MNKFGVAKVAYNQFIADWIGGTFMKMLSMASEIHHMKRAEQNFSPG
jgi:hypothetical protein